MKKEENNLISEKSKKRTKKLNLSLGVSILLVALIVLFANLVFGRIFFRLDLTENQQYSLSNSTKKKLKNLDDIVNIEAYFSSDLPERVQSIRTQLRDLLEEFRARSGGKLFFKFIDPSEDPALQQKLRMRGIPEVSLNVYEKDKASVRKAYMGMSILYQDKAESVPIIDSVNNIEYQVVSALIKLSSDKIYKIGYTVGKGEKDLDNDLTPLASHLRKQYSLEKVELGKGSIASDVNTLLILGPTQEYSDKELYYLDEYVLRGGKIFFAIDQVVYDQNSRRAQGKLIKTGLEKFIEHLGVRIDQNLVQDMQSAQAPFRTEFGTLIQDYPLWPRLTHFDREMVIVSRIDSLVTQWASSLQSVQIKGVKYSTLAKTSDKAWQQKGMFNLSPQMIRLPQESQLKTFDMVAMVDGSYESYFKSAKLPDGIKNVKIDSSKSLPSQHIVIGDSDFLIYGLQNRRQGGNLNFFLNSIDFLTMGDELIGIRSKRVGDRPLLPIDDAARRALKYITILVMPLFVIILGLSKYYRRRSIKRIYESMQRNVQAAK